MKNIMSFENGYQAVISYDPEITMFRGEFVGLNGGADFYATDIVSLKTEGELSLQEFLAVCAENGIEPKKKEGKFALRLNPELYDLVYTKAKSHGISINTYIANTLQDAVQN